MTAHRLKHVLAVVCLFAACRSTSRPGGPPNILLVLIDTWRADRADWYAPEHGLTPFLNTLAAHGTVFWNAYAPSSWTSPSVASLLTSRYLPQHGVTVLGSVLPDAEQTLPELLQARGYVTAGFSANPLISKDRGFAQGFDHFETLARDIPILAKHGLAKERAGHVNEQALAWLQTLRRPGGSPVPLFLYLHYMEPHAPCVPSPPAVDQVLERATDAAARRQSMRASPSMGVIDRAQRVDPTALPALKTYYDAAVLELDGKVRELFAALDARGVLRNAIVIVTADHGEELMEHGRIGHAKTLFDEVLRVPLLLADSAHSERTDVHEVVSLLDVAPTLLDAVGIKIPTAFEGRSLGRSMAGERPANPGEAYGELVWATGAPADSASFHVRSLVVDSNKLIVRADGTMEAYDLRADAGETSPNGLTDAARRTLQQRLEAIAGRASRSRSQPQATALDDQTKERLRALGYQD